MDATAPIAPALQWQQKISNSQFIGQEYSFSVLSLKNHEEINNLLFDVLKILEK